MNKTGELKYKKKKTEENEFDGQTQCSWINCYSEKREW
jgi:hypothetical protein